MKYKRLNLEYDFVFFSVTRSFEMRLFIQLADKMAIEQEVRLRPLVQAQGARPRRPLRHASLKS